MSKYLVTGGAGFIGSNIVEELLRRGETVRVLDNLSTGREENMTSFRDEIDFQKGDIRSEDDVKKALEGVDIVLHQAAFRSVPRSIDDPVTANDVNVRGTLNLLILAKKAKIKRFVYASSSSVYGVCEVFPQKETLPLGPVSPYAVSKLAGEYYCRMFAKTMGLETVCLRYFNVFGPRQNPDSKYSTVIPAFVESLVNDQPCRIDGNGKQVRDFTFVTTIVDANIAAANTAKISGEVFNVASGQDYSVLDVAENLKKILDKQIESIHGLRRRGDVDRTFADISRMNEVLKVEPRIHFHEGLEKTVKWFVSDRMVDVT